MKKIKKLKMMVKTRLKQNEDNDDENYSIEIRGDEGKGDKTKMVKDYNEKYSI